VGAGVGEAVGEADGPSVGGSEKVSPIVGLSSVDPDVSLGRGACVGVGFLPVTTSKPAAIISTTQINPKTSEMLRQRSSFTRVLLMRPVTPRPLRRQR
jgi:hypothetical protein